MHWDSKPEHYSENCLKYKMLDIASKINIICI